MENDIAKLRGKIAENQVALKSDLKRTHQLITAYLARQNLPVALAEDRGQAYRVALNNIGVLNYENDVVSGERHFIQRFLTWQPRALIFDVGANEGQYAKLVKEIGPDAVVHSFEPHPVSFAKLERAATETGLFAHRLALGDVAGGVEIFDYADEAGSQHASLYRDVIEKIHQRSAAQTKVPCDTLDAVAERLGLTRIGLLKIDTEGHELAVLRGAKDLLARGAIDVIQFEFNEMNVISRAFFKDFFDILWQYQLYRLLMDGVIRLPVYDPVFMEIFAYQNIVCVRRDIDPSWLLGRL